MPAFFDRPLSALTTKWRIFHEESVDLNPRDEKTDFEELRGRADTRIYRHGQDTLAVSTDSRHISNPLSRITGLIPKNGSVLLFADSLLDTVATVIKAKRARLYTLEQRAAVSVRLARYQFQRKTSAVQSDIVDLKPTIAPQYDPR